MKIDISMRIEAWARWSRIDVLPKKTSCSMGRLIISEREDFEIELSDDEAMKIDKAVQKLKNRHYKKYLAIYYLYLCQFDDKRTAQKMGYSVRHIYNLKSKALEILEDYLRRM